MRKNDDSSYITFLPHHLSAISFFTSYCLGSFCLVLVPFQCGTSMYLEMSISAT